MDKIINEIYSKYGISCKFGAEIEFYLTSCSKEAEEEVKSIFADLFFEKERGNNQFEVKFSPKINSQELIDSINSFKLEIKKWSKLKKIGLSFAAKPYDGEPGSSLQIHLSMYKNEQNIFASNEEILVFAVGGLCATIKKNLKYFIPKPEGLKRLVPKQNAPTTISWGGNNRTVAIRIPNSDDYNRRIEHRVSSADASPKIVIEKILAGILYGIKNKITPPAKIYGDASDEQYNLEYIKDYYLPNKI